ncbi:SLP adapter and CSK-interacting membrane protein [Rhinatrema bivittatum]|uniref:SLP adapter and CSK-interacting membrane protein n=1 Tax=Rhinatrema bivittatum TaxID=194408 RepID=UPI00112BDA64|nr:SLP adapter and CSK-interacting membrane protein [Rhinatrema bivittatum]
MTWMREYFWVLVIAGILLVCGIIGIIMFCLCRTQLQRGLSRKIQKSFAVRRQVQNSSEDNRVYLENSIYQRSGNDPPLPSRVIIAEETRTEFHPSLHTLESGGYPKPFSLPDKRQSDSGYIDILPEINDGENDYDDAAMPGTTEYENEIKRM